MLDPDLNKMPQPWLLVYTYGRTFKSLFSSLAQYQINYVFHHPFINSAHVRCYQQITQDFSIALFLLRKFVFVHPTLSVVPQ